MPKLNTKQTTWNLTFLFTSDDDPAIEQDKQALQKRITTFTKKWKSHDDYLQNVAALKEALDDYEKIMSQGATDGKQGYYFFLRHMQDMNNPKIRAEFSKAQNLSSQLQTELQFFELRLAKVSKQNQKLFLKDKTLRPYKPFLERIFVKSEHNLEENEEKIITLKREPAENKWTQLVAGLLAKETRSIDMGKKEETKSFSEIMSLMNNSNKTIRDSAAVAFNEIQAQYADVAEAEINAILSNKKIDDELRKFSRPDSQRHLDDDISTDAVDTLLTAVSSRFDISQQFYKLKTKLFGLPKLAYHERNLEYGHIDKQYSYEDAVELVNTVFANLDQEFSKIFQGFVSEGRIDVLPHPGKRSGAFCIYPYLTAPTYVLTNFTNQLLDVTTLAHEVGHGINGELMKKKLNGLSYGTPLSTAEVSSTFMEDFVLQEILREADDELRLSVMMTKLNGDVGAIFRQVACYQFEQELHKTFREKGYLSKQEIGQIFQKHMVEYMGPAVNQDPGSENWWIYWNHIRIFFYVYAYANGLLIGKAMQNGVKQDHAFVERVKEFLSAGMSDTPRNIFKKMDIDITNAAFWNRGLDEIEKSLKETEKLAEKLGKI